MTNQITKEDLEKHAKWLRHEDGGVRLISHHADMQGADMRGVDMRSSDLCGANFFGVDLRNSSLFWADLSKSVLYNANLSAVDMHGSDFSKADMNNTYLGGADLHDANLSGADMRGASLRGTDLRVADLRHANLSGADMHKANLWGAYLQDADLSGADLSDTILIFADLEGADFRNANLFEANLHEARNVPEAVLELTSITPAGELIGYKRLANNRIAKLLIPADARRSNATGRKCRAEFAKVLAVESVNGKRQFKEGFSFFNCWFIYRVGETVHSDSWDEDRWNECSHGIHFFLKRDEAGEF